MQSLVPLLNNKEEDIQLATIKCLKNLIPSFRGASGSDINFVWTYLKSHTVISVKAVCNFIMQVIRFLIMN
jgi:hypothetical protein